MTNLLIILHFLGFSAGIGGSLANLIIGRIAAGSDPSARPALGRAARGIGLLATGGLVLLWLTGVTLVQVGWDGWAALPALFWAKLAMVVILTAASALMNANVILALRRGTPPPPARMAMLGRLGAGAAVLALILAVVTFSR
jgi:hypothetical protein